MSEIRMAWRAFKNMMRAALRDPVWAVTMIAISPFRMWKYVLGCMVIILSLTMMLLWLQNHLPSFLGRVVTIAFNLGLLVLLFRFFVNPMILHFGDDEEGANATHRTARFATDKEIAPMTQSGSGLLIGRTLKSHKLLRYDGPAHLLTIAPTRTGKGVGTVIPNLLTLDRSVVCVDPKGDNTRVAGRARNRFGPVHVLDPFGVTGVPTASFNPVALLDPAGIDVAEDAAIRAPTATLSVAG